METIKYIHFTSDTHVNTYVKSNLKILLEETPETYYWIGFLMADGNFAQRRIRLHLQEKDNHHLDKFAKFVQYEGSRKYGVYACGTEIVDKLKEKFKISSRKTFEPCDLTSIKRKDLQLAWVAGFIDGDGCIGNLHKRKDFNLRIKLHSSWIDNLNWIGNVISIITKTQTNSATINNQGYAQINFGNTLTLKRLKIEVLKLKLPILERKWGKIDLNFVSKYELASTRTQVVIESLGKMKKQEIAKKLGISSSAVSMIIKRNRLNE